MHSDQVDRFPQGRRSKGMAAVAEFANVSIGTVSNVLNYPERVSESTTRRVLDAIDALGFVRNAQATRLASGRSDLVGAVLADLRNSLFTDIAEGAQSTAEAADLRMLISNSLADNDRQGAYISTFEEMHVAGFLLAPMAGALDAFHRAHARGTPIVLVNYREHGLSCCTVLSDNTHGGFLAASHLIEQGATRLAFVAHSFDFQPVQERWLGVQRAAGGRSGVSLERLDAGGHLFDDGREFGRRMSQLPEEERPDGVVAVTDSLASGIIEGLLASSSLRVPGDVMVVGCEGDRSAETSRLSLTTVEQAGLEMGRRAMLLLQDEIENPETHIHTTLVLEPRLRVLGSSSRRG